MCCNNLTSGTQFGGFRSSRGYTVASGYGGVLSSRGFPAFCENVSESDLEDGSATGLAETDDTDSTENIENSSALHIMKAKQSFKQDFHTEMDGVLVAIKTVQSAIKECSALRYAFVFDTLAEKYIRESQCSQKNATNN